MRSIAGIIDNNILLLDGAFATMIPQRCGYTDLLSIQQPETVAAIHRAYLDAGANIISTNTFNAQKRVLTDFSDLQISDINKHAVDIARKEAMAASYNIPRFIAGTVGSSVNGISADKESYQLLKDAYTTQITALLLAGVDCLLIETVYDLANAGAAIDAASDAESFTDKHVPIMLSASFCSSSGTLPMGENFQDWIQTAEKAKPFAVGFNCFSCNDTAATHILRFLKLSPYKGIFYPNAGFPDSQGKYHVTPSDFRKMFSQIITPGFSGIIGGCCGSTPKHIAALRNLIDTL